MSDSWNFSSEQDRTAMQEEVTKENCGNKLALIQRAASLSRRALAKILGVSEGTLRRIENRASLPTDEFMNRLRALCVIGKARFEAMCESEKEKASETLGATGGVIAGVGGAVGAVSAAGAVSGLSAAGITSGLAAIGGGTMLGGIAVVAAIPVVTGLAGYGLVRGIKAICEANKLSSTEVDGRWEIRITGFTQFAQFLNDCLNELRRQRQSADSSQQEPPPTGASPGSNNNTN